jgi:hypothetical protein
MIITAQVSATGTLPFVPVSLSLDYFHRFSLELIVLCYVGDYRQSSWWLNVVRDL